MVRNSSMFKIGAAGDPVQLVQARETICTETPKVSTDHIQKAVCRNIFFPLSFFKATWSSQICNVRDFTPCQVHQGLRSLNLKRRVVSGKFLALGQLETFSQNKGSSSPCGREPESRQYSQAVLNLWLHNRLFWGYRSLGTRQPAVWGCLSATCKETRAL